MDDTELRSAIEAVLFVAGEPVKAADLGVVFGVDEDRVKEQLELIKVTMNEHVQGFMIEEAGGGYRLATRAEQEPNLRKYFAKRGEGRLSIAALETLAIVAYRQPITAPEISELRSVNSTGVLRTLLDRRMIRIAGRKNVVGSPFLYRTTRDFLVHFGLNEIQDLPKLEEFSEVLGDQVSEELFPLAPIESSPGQSSRGAEDRSSLQEELPFQQNEMPDSSPLPDNEDEVTPSSAGVPPAFGRGEKHSMDGRPHKAGETPALHGENDIDANQDHGETGDTNANGTGRNTEENLTVESESTRKS